MCKSLRIMLLGLVALLGVISAEVHAQEGEGAAPQAMDVAEGVAAIDSDRHVTVTLFPGENIPEVRNLAPVNVEDSYHVGVDDVLTINVLKPEEIIKKVTVNPDGNIAFPYIGQIKVKDKSLQEIQEEIKTKLADGYLKYPIVSVELEESRSRRFFVYGEVNKPGAYPIEENTTVLRAISMAGGFTKFGSSSRVKVLRPRDSGAGYESTKVSVDDLMNGIADADLPVVSGDIVVVSEGIF